MICLSLLCSTIRLESRTKAEIIITKMVTYCLRICACLSLAGGCGENACDTQKRAFFSHLVDRVKASLEATGLVKSSAASILAQTDPNLLRLASIPRNSKSDPGLSGHFNMQLHTINEAARSDKKSHSGVRCGRKPGGGSAKSGRCLICQLMTGTRRRGKRVHLSANQKISLYHLDNW